MSTFSPELTFVPVTAPYHFTDQASVESVVTHVNNSIIAISAIAAMMFRAKVEPFHLEEYGRPGSAYGWCVEVTPTALCPLETEWLKKGDESYTSVMDTLTALFKVLREDHGLVPSVTKKSRKSGRQVIKTYPTGGCHFHFQPEFFTESVNWYKDMESYHRALITDYANRPYIRWLLAEWSDNHNSECLVNKQDLKNASEIDSDYLFRRAIHDNVSIRPRFMNGLKTTYFTFELRFVRMLESAEEVRAVAILLDTWMRFIFNYEFLGGTEFNLTPDKFRSMCRVKSAEKIVQKWLDEIGIDGKIQGILMNLFERNYVTRIKNGKMV